MHMGQDGGGDEAVDDEQAVQRSRSRGMCLSPRLQAMTPVGCCGSGGWSVDVGLFACATLGAVPIASKAFRAVGVRFTFCGCHVNSCR